MRLFIWNERFSLFVCKLQGERKAVPLIPVTWSTRMREVIIRPYWEKSCSSSFWVMVLGSPLTYRLASRIEAELGRAYDTCKKKHFENSLQLWNDCGLCGLSNSTSICACWTFNFTFTFGVYFFRQFIANILHWQYAAFRCQRSSAHLFCLTLCWWSIFLHWPGAAWDFRKIMPQNPPLKNKGESFRLIIIFWKGTTCCKGFSVIHAHSQIRDIHMTSKELCNLSQRRNENVNSILMCTTSNPVSKEKKCTQDIHPKYNGWSSWTL